MHAPYVTWAAHQGVAKGYEGKFNPNDCISRQDIAVMLVNYADKVGNYTLPASNDAIVFADDTAISSYARKAVYAMQQAGIISGRGNNAFAPTASATRAEAAKMTAVLLHGIEK